MVYVRLLLITTFEVFRVSDHMFQISHSLACLSQVWMVTFGGVCLTFVKNDLKYNQPELPARLASRPFTN